MDTKTINNADFFLLYFMSFYAFKYPENIDLCLPSMRSPDLGSFLMYTLSPYFSCNTAVRLPVE